MFRQLKTQLITLFGISSAEANGIIIVFAFIALILSGSFFIPGFFMKHPDTYLSDKRKLDSLVSIIESDTAGNPPRIEHVKIDNQRHFFQFDPNSVQRNELDSMGFPVYIAERLIKFRNAGGRFNIRDDLKKIYGLNDNFFRQIKPFVYLPDSIQNHQDHKTGKETKVKNIEVMTRFDINKVDSAVLTSINGIGPVLTGRIIKYRALLGGYISKDQLNEIYGLKDPALLQLKNECYVDEAFTAQHIKINFAEWKDLARHPYIGKNYADKLIKYRDSAGPFHSIKDLKEIKGLNDSLISKLGYYLEF